jgi:hypothetical protein
VKLTHPSHRPVRGLNLEKNGRQIGAGCRCGNGWKPQLRQADSHLARAPARAAGVLTITTGSPSLALFPTPLLLRHPHRLDDRASAARCSYRVCNGLCKLRISIHRSRSQICLGALIQVWVPRLLEPIFLLSNLEKCLRQSTLSGKQFRSSLNVLYQLGLCCSAFSSIKKVTEHFQVSGTVCLCRSPFFAHRSHEERISSCIGTSLLRPRFGGNLYERQAGMVFKIMFICVLQSLCTHRPLLNLRGLYDDQAKSFTACQAGRELMSLYHLHIYQN